MKRRTNSSNLLKIAHEGYAPAGRLYSDVLSNFSKIFSFGHPITLSLQRWGEIWHHHLSYLYTGALRCAQCCQ